MSQVSQVTGVSAPSSAHPYSPRGTSGQSSFQMQNINPGNFVDTSGINKLFGKIPPPPPPEWTTRIDAKSGKPFFHNNQTGQTSWTLPAGQRPAPLVLSKDVRQQQSNYLQQRSLTMNNFPVIRTDPNSTVAFPGSSRTECFQEEEEEAQTRPLPFFQQGLIGENGMPVSPYGGQHTTGVRPPPQWQPALNFGYGIPPYGSPTGLIGENGMPVPPYGSPTGLIGENGMPVPPYGSPTGLIGENGMPVPPYGSPTGLIGENGLVNPYRINPNSYSTAYPQQFFGNQGATSRPGGLPTPNPIGDPWSMNRNLLDAQRLSFAKQLRSNNSSIINPDSMRPSPYASRMINPTPSLNSRISETISPSNVDVRKIASKGSLSSLIDKRSAGVHATFEHESKQTIQAKLIQYAPLTPIITLPPWIFNNIRFVLPQGCWLLKYTPASAPQEGWFTYHMDGTMRIEHDSLTSVKMSGDLYSHLKIQLPWYPSSPEPNPGAGKVPIFKRSKYNCYLRVTNASFVNANTVELQFERHTLNSSNNWIVDSGYTATMNRQTLPPTSSYPHKSRYFVGNVYQSSTCVASLTMGWICPQYRDIVLELDSVAASPVPVTNSAGFTWNTLFNDINYGANVVVSDTNLGEASGQSWNSSELHTALVNNRDSNNLDAEWRYHLFFCRRLDMTDRGIMFDNGSTDANNTPREGAATASHWVFPSGWGACTGQVFHTTDGYLRTAIHELGHAFNLLHNSTGTNFMRTTPSINSAATPSTPFPSNATWSYSNQDLERLRHWPDPVVRPGGLDFAAQPYSSIPISDEGDPILIPAPNLELDIKPLRPTVPLGAPVRFTISCKNTSTQSVPGPFVLSLANPNVRGTVTTFDSNSDAPVNNFSSIFKCNDGQYDEPCAYEPGQTRSSSITLIRGCRGPLFSSSGMHRVSVEVSWIMDPDSSNPGEAGPPLRFILQAECTVMIAPPANPAQAQQALTVLSCPNLMPAFIFGTPLAKLDPKTRSALQTAINSPALRAHFSVLRARWYRAQRAASTGQPLKLDEDAVLSDSERIKIDALTRIGAQLSTDGAVSSQSTAVNSGK